MRLNVCRAYGINNAPTTTMALNSFVSKLLFLKMRKKRRFHFYMLVHFIDYINIHHTPILIQNASCYPKPPFAIRPDLMMMTMTNVQIKTNINNSFFSIINYKLTALNNKRKQVVTHACNFHHHYHHHRHRRHRFLFYCVFFNVRGGGNLFSQQHFPNAGH